MGLLDVILGRSKLARPAADRLFAISTAYVKFQTELGTMSRGTAKRLRCCRACRRVGCGPFGAQATGRPPASK